MAFRYVYFVFVFSGVDGVLFGVFVHVCSVFFGGHDGEDVWSLQCGLFSIIRWLRERLGLGGNKMELPCLSQRALLVLAGSLMVLISDEAIGL